MMNLDCIEGGWSNDEGFPEVKEEPEAKSMVSLEFFKRKGVFHKYSLFVERSV